MLTFFPSIWIRSRATSRPDLDIPKNWTIRGGRSRTHPKIGTWQYTRSQSNTTLQSARYLQGLRRHYNKSTKQRSVQVGDLVLWRIQKTDGRHKLLSPWKVPFIVAKVTEPGTYELTTEDGIEVRNTWHISQLRRFYACRTQDRIYVARNQDSWSIK
jgi:hypothetical protein